MNRSKSRSNRFKISPLRSPSCRRNVDLNDDNNPLNNSVLDWSSTFTRNANSPRNDDDVGAPFDKANYALPSPEIEKLQICNGFKIDTYQPFCKNRHSESKFIDSRSPVNSVARFSDSTTDRLPELDKSSKSSKNASMSSRIPNISLELQNSMETDVGNANLPPFEESIVEGFSIMAFSTLSDIKLYARLTDKRDETLNPRTGSRSPSVSYIPGRRRRGIPRYSIGRGKRIALHASTNADTNASTISTDSKPICNTEDNDGKCDPEHLRPLHIDITPSTTSTGWKSGSDVTPRHNECEQNCPLSSNKTACFMSSADKAFPVLSPKKGIISSKRTAGSLTTPKQDLFSIAALTAVEEREEAPSAMKSPLEQHQLHMHSRQLPRPPHPENGHPLTPAQWLERLSNHGIELWNKEGAGDAKVAEEELQQLTHLLLTDRVFTEQVSRLPPVAQIMSFYNQQQHNQLRQQKQQRCHISSSPSSSSSSCSSSMTQSFAYLLNSQQNSIGVGAPQIAATVSSASLTNSESPSSLTFTPSVDTPAPSSVVMTTMSSSAAHFPTSVSSVSVAATAPLLTSATAFFNSATAAVAAAALVGGMRPPAPVFQGQAHSIPTGQFLHATANTSIPPAPYPLAHHPFMPNSSHLSTLWSHQQPPRLQSPGANYLYFMTPSSHPSPATLSINPLLARKATPMDAVDLTSVASGESGIGSRPLIPQPPLSFPNFWTRYLSPAVVPSLNQQSQSENRHIHRSPNFRDLFCSEGVNFNRGATAHLRICYYILRDKAHGLKSVNPLNPWWYAEPNPTLSQPKPREHMPPLPHGPHHQIPPRFPNYDHFLRTALSGSDSSNCAAPLPPPHPIAIDLTRSPQPHAAGLAMLSVQNAFQPREIPHSLDPSVVAKFFQQQQQQQDTDLMMALKRRRVMIEGGPFISPMPTQPQLQLLPPAHYQNGGMQIPLGLPYSQFRHPL